MAAATTTSTADEATKPIHTLVLDTNTIIQNNPSLSTLLAKSSQLITVPAIIAEIKDAVTKSRVETMLKPFLTIRQPSAASMQFVTDFARKTGDLPVLSRPDLQIVALTYELEVERNGGDWRLRRGPGQRGLNGPFPGKEGEEEVKGEGEKGEVGGEVKADVKAEVQAEVQPEAEVQSQEAQSQEAQSQEAQPQEVLLGEAGADAHTIAEERAAEVSPPTEEQAEPANEAEAAAEQPEDEGEWSAPISRKSKKGGKAQKNFKHVKNVTKSFAQTSIKDEALAAPQPDSTPKIDSAQNSAPDQDDSESDGEGWITPGNLAQKQAEDAAPAAADAYPQKKMEVAVLTTDFAMQNVILQINLNLLSSSMMRIKNVRSVVLRCQACFLVTKEMGKQFCPRCGKPTMTRVSCSTTNSGEFRLHLKKNFQYNSRGDRYSIPKAVAGASNGRVKGGGKGGWGNELILAEDQKEYERAITTEKRTKERNLMDEDYLPGILTGERSKTGGRIKVGAGRSVNSKKRT